MAKYYFTLIDIAVVFFSLITFICSVCTDILVCIQFMLHGQALWGWLMVGFISTPSLVMSSFSLAWNVHDKTLSPLVVVSHLLLCAPVHRYIKTIVLGVSSRKTRKGLVTQQALKEQSDSCILRLFENFLECAPLLVLQTYVLLYDRSVVWFVAISVSCSLLSLSWSITSYTDSQRRLVRAKRWARCTRLFLHWAWQVFITASRVAALVFFARIFHYWIFVFVGGHWLLAFIWLSVMGTDFNTGCWEKWLFRLVCGFIYIFIFLNVSDGASRWRVTTFYLLMFVENTAMVVLYVTLGNDSTLWSLAACLVVFVGFFLGLLFMVLYYEFLRRSGQKGQAKRSSLGSQRGSVASASSCENGSQIFSIQPSSPANVLQEVVINIDEDHINSYNSSTNTPSVKAGPHSPISSKLSDSEASRSHLSLQKVWQSGMVSSSSSSSSLLSIVESTNSGRQTPSIKSDCSSSSENNLLASKLSVDDVSRKKFDHSQNGSRIIAGPDRLSLSTTVEGNSSKSGSSKSPTMSRDSWARSSDSIRGSMVLGDFTVLGFDDSSSTDRKNSDSSSFSSHPKGMSPLNVSSLLWKDVNSRLRATIAATVAAATSSSSSPRALPGKNQSLSSATTTEDSLNSSHKSWGLSHNIAFLETALSYKEDKQNVSINSSHQSALSKDFFDQDSDLSFVEKTFINCGERSMKTPQKQPRSTQNISSKLNSSSVPDDSTLTLSKLGIKESGSFNQMQKQELHNIGNGGVGLFQSPCSLKLSPLQLKAGETDDTISTFTEQELVQIISSLQNYDGNGSFCDSGAREGLALTLEDLKLSRRTSPEPSPLSVAHLAKSRSASSLFHDSSESSPASSASKMNQLMNARKAEEFSPNALKIMDLPVPVKGQGFDLTSDLESSSNISLPHSVALKFIIDAYGPSTPKSHHLLPSIPHHNRSSNSSFADSAFPSHEKSTNLKRQSLRQSYSKQRLSVHNLKHADLPHKLSRRSYSSGMVQDVSNKTRGAVSRTKKLSVHFSPSPSKAVRFVTDVSNGQQLGDVDSGPELSYVAGHYCPPLCSNNPEVQQKARLSSSQVLNVDSRRRVSNSSLPSIEYYCPSASKPTQPPAHPIKADSYLTEDDLKRSASHVAKYFNEALEMTSASPWLQSRLTNHQSQPHLRVHNHTRQPLKPLDNSPIFPPTKFSPHTGGEHWMNRSLQDQHLLGEKLRHSRERESYSAADEHFDHVSSLPQPQRLSVKPPLRKTDYNM